MIHIMDYNFPEIEKKWQKYWIDHDTYRSEIDYSKPKYYVLDMFPYPSGAGLHVGHPLGYIASDIFSRFKRLQGFNVLHPMGYDAYGLPAEQYAIQTGTHPAVTTAKNIARYREQMDQLGFCFDWNREVKTCDPAYYKWTQWTFIQLFHHWYNNKTQKAEPVSVLERHFEQFGNEGIRAAMSVNWVKELIRKDPGFGAEWDGNFSAVQWNAFSKKQQQEILMNYRLAYLSDAMVNWCPDLGTVLANDEVANGYSVRGGHPVERKRMRQWFLRITAYAQRLLDGLETIDFSESLKEMQRNWIGRSEGAEIFFPVKGTDLHLPIFTTRPDTIFGATFMVLAPEHEYIPLITTIDRKQSVDHYIREAMNRSERERMAEVKNITGVFTGAYCINPISGESLPVWVADYVLSGYGTGAIMAVPAHDSRDYDFAKHFDLPIIEVVSGGDISEHSYDAKDGILINSGFINGMNVKAAIGAVIQRISEFGLGHGTLNFRLRDAIFSRQRYWGEPFPVFYKDGIPSTLDENELPLLLPEVDKYLPTETGDPPLARAANWLTRDGYQLETSTMPGFAGSSGYYLRYMDPGNDKEYFSRKAVEYWQDVDLYIGGSEHATGHLIYSRFWNKFLYDIGLSVKEEPFKKLVNQGMIQGISQKARVLFRSKDDEKSSSENPGGLILPEGFDYLDKNPDCQIAWINIPVEYVHQNVLNEEQLELCRRMFTALSNYKIATLGEILESRLIPAGERDRVKQDYGHLFTSGSVTLKPEVEKMSKSKYNVVNPDDLVAKYGADTFRMYEMFLGPLEQSKPWDTNGIEGVFRFIRKFWRLYHDENNNFRVSDEPPKADELRILHRTIKKVSDDIERLSFNTVVSTLMICTNELTDLKCSNRGILTDLLILISPYAPHLAEELWQNLGHSESIFFARLPEFKAEYLVENTFEYPVSFNGKMRFKLELPADMDTADIEKAAVAAKESEKWLQGKPPRKIVVVKKKIINIVI